ncbi:hypothetical protein [Stenotrophomonas sp.]|uniref:hypothetical protein n=1 Tax=Stenotrophomonas sp. TaxID=69392 RepID=UPI0028B2459D|nr:hypothetical protein [Stenotrophomonas sp.]
MKVARALWPALGSILFIAGVLAAPKSLAHPPADVLGSLRRDAQLDAALTLRAQEILDRMERLEGQSNDIRVQAFFDINEGALRVHFGPGILPTHFGASFEDQHDEFRHSLTHIAQKVAPVKVITLRYDGREIEAHFPEVRQEAEDAQRARERRLQGMGTPDADCIRGPGVAVAGADVPAEVEAATAG